jgi:hypothetical protein
MIIDCGRCTVRGAACENCAVTFIASAVTFVTEAPPARAPATAGPAGSPPAAAANTRSAPSSRPASALVPPGKPQRTTTGKTASPASPEPVIELDAAEIRALAALANAGLIPPLRYAPSMAKAS